MNKNEKLLQKFIDFNAAKRLAGRKKRTLLAVSGGMDSMVMMDLFHKAGYPGAIAHCNFNLRGEESDGDEKLVRSLGEKHKVEVFVRSFDTKKFAEEKGISIQLAARELRYAWFEELRNEKKFDCVATAHHLNDNIETILLNFIKGTGIRGLRGIPARQGRIIRPILSVSRSEIENYQQENHLSYREDSSNAEDKYTRNKIRHSLIPLMQEINPSLENTMGEKIELFTSLEELYKKQVRNASHHLFLKQKNDIYIPILKLKKTGNASNTLFEFLKDYGFNGAQVEDMLGSLDGLPGKQFISYKARVIKDRRFFILTGLPEKDFTIKVINEDDEEVALGDKKIILSNATPTDTGEIKISGDKNLAFLDRAKLEFPLIVRRWKQGDYFYPFGMKMKKKKLKKFFTDEKIPINEKENIWVLESNQKIAWVAGYRIDERFKVTPSTSSVLKLRLKEIPVNSNQ